MAMALHAPADHLALQHVESCKEGSGSVPLVIVGHGAGAAFLHGQSRLGAIQRLDLALLVDRQDHGLGRRVDVESNDVAHLRRKLRVVGELEGSDAVRLKPVRVLDALDVGKAHACGLRHRAAGPMGRLARRFGQRQGDDPSGHFRPKGLDARGPGLSRRRPSTPSSQNRSCQRQTAVLLIAVFCMIAIVPSPSAVASTILARQTCF